MANYQDEARAYFRQALGRTNGSYPEVMAQFYKALANGDIDLGNSQALADLEQRVAALEQAAGGD